MSVILRNSTLWPALPSLEQLIRGLFVQPWIARWWFNEPRDFLWWIADAKPYNARYVLAHTTGRVLALRRGEQLDLLYHMSSYRRYKMGVHELQLGPASSAYSPYLDSFYRRPSQAEYHWRWTTATYVHPSYWDTHIQEEEQPRLV